MRWREAFLWQGPRMQWLRDEMRMLKSAPTVGGICVEQWRIPSGVYVVPAFTGLGAPYWNPYARGRL